MEFNDIKQLKRVNLDSVDQFTIEMNNNDSSWSELEMNVGRFRVNSIGFGRRVEYDKMPLETLRTVISILTVS